MTVTYPRTNSAGETVWACCESAIGPACSHKTYGLGPKTLALLAERDHPGGRVPDVNLPELGGVYRAGDLPAGSVVAWPSSRPDPVEYVVGRSGLCMRWEQPIPRSDTWTVVYAGRLAEGEWMTPRERAETDAAARRWPPCGGTNE